MFFKQYLVNYILLEDVMFLALDEVSCFSLNLAASSISTVCLSNLGAENLIMPLPVLAYYNLYQRIPHANKTLPKMETITIPEILINRLNL